MSDALHPRARWPVVLALLFIIEHIFTFDTDDFRTLGFVVVPADTGDA
jgi:hypothetical protein